MKIGGQTKMTSLVPLPYLLRALCQVSREGGVSQAGVSCEGGVSQAEVSREGGSVRPG